MMKLLNLSLINLLILCGMPLLAAAAETAQVYVVHGIPGSDLGAAPTLPVDISVNGACALKNFKFGNIAGPIALPAGNISVKISLADSSNPCAGAVAIGPATFSLETGENATIIAHLTASGQPTAKKFTNDDSRTLGGRSRITVHHTAAAPLVDVNINPKVTVRSFKNGERFTVEAPQTTTQVSISPAGSEAPVFGPVSVEIGKSTRYLVFAVGSVAANTFTLLLQTY